MSTEPCLNRRVELYFEYFFFPEDELARQVFNGELWCSPGHPTETWEPTGKQFPDNAVGLRIYEVTEERLVIAGSSFLLKSERTRESVFIPIVRAHYRR